MIYYLKDYVMKGNHAGSKAVADCEQILKDLDYNELDLKIGKFVYYYSGFFIRQINMRKLKKDDIVVIQYPQHGKKNKSMTRNFKFLRKKGVKLIAIIHDVQSLREQENIDKIENEIDILNSFNVLISHNKSMTEWLIGKGYKNQVVNLNIFDYLSEEKNILDTNLDFKKVYFAGNLEKNKSGFLYKDDMEKVKVSIDLFGPNYIEKESKGLVNYKGNFPPNKLSENFKEGFGLIWDGMSITECSGKYGEYLKYNNPHKASLYLSSGLPIIVWNKSAIASFILENKVGFTIGSLDQMQSYLDDITQEEYRKLKKNVLMMQQKIISGTFMKEALIKAVKIADNNLKKHEASVS